MRLEVVEQGYDRSFMSPTVKPGGIAKALTYRKELWGLPWSRAAQQVLRGPSEWSVGERELIAAYVSRQNQCQFCTGAHTATAALANDGGDGLVSAVLEDPGSAPISAPLRATLELVRKLTLEPDDFGPADVEPALDAGASPAAIRDAIHVCTLFCTINRCADTLGAEPSDRGFGPGATRLLERGYLASFAEGKAGGGSG